MNEEKNHVGRPTNEEISQRNKQKNSTIIPAIICLFLTIIPALSIVGLIGAIVNIIICITKFKTKSIKNIIAFVICLLIIIFDLITFAISFSTVNSIFSESKSNSFIDSYRTAYKEIKYDFQDSNYDLEKVKSNLSQFLEELDMQKNLNVQLNANDNTYTLMVCAKGVSFNGEKEIGTPTGIYEDIDLNKFYVDSDNIDGKKIYGIGDNYKLSKHCIFGNYYIGS